MDSESLQHPIYKRILVKLSGEALQGDHLFGIDANKLSHVADEIGLATKLGVQVALVIGGGNVIRGAELCSVGFDRVTADQMGMLATVINGLAVRDALINHGIPTTLMSAIPIPGVALTFDRSLAKEKLEAGNVVIFSGGTGNPLVTTDTAAALRGIEIGADIIMKATKVDGVFNDDPIKNPHAERYESLTYDQAVEKRLRVMDLNAILLCQESGVMLRVFNMNKQGALHRILLGENIGTLIKASE